MPERVKGAACASLFVCDNRMVLNNGKKDGVTETLSLLLTLTDKTPLSYCKSKFPESHNMKVARMNGFVFQGRFETCMIL